MRHDSSAQVPRARAHVDQVIAGPHERFVVLDDDDRVPLLLQVAQRGDQPIVVARMQADRRLIEQIQHADQPRADSGRQPHALPFAAAERVGRPIERQIIGADAIEKCKPPHDLRHDRLGDRPLVVGKRQARERTRCAAVTERAVISWIARPPSRQARASGRKPRAVAIGADVASSRTAKPASESPSVSLRAAVVPRLAVVPNPWHVGHAPYGLLKLNVRGSISPMLVWHRGHA